MMNDEYFDTKMNNEYFDTKMLLFSTLPTRFFLFFSDFLFQRFFLLLLLSQSFLALLFLFLLRIITLDVSL